MIKYLGSKRALVGVLGEIAAASGATTALDLFTGTTRVAQEFKRRGLQVTANDIATYSQVLADCYIGTDADDVDARELDDALQQLNALPGRRGYVTATFCEEARYFQSKNGMRIDAIRDEIEASYAGHPLYPVLLTSLLLAADKVDSTTGLQMAYLKRWAPRASNDLHLVTPALIPGPGAVQREDAATLVERIGAVDLAYLDPPYNQHRYFTNYHVWETLVRWDAPEYYGIACKRIDSRDSQTKSAFNVKRDMPSTFCHVVQAVQAGLLVVSYNDESWVAETELMGWLRDAGYEDVRLLAFDSKRYVGAQIGVYNQSGSKVGTVSHLRNTEFVFVAGPSHQVSEAVASVPVG